MVDRTLGIEDVAGAIKPGMTIGIGGWGSRRKPMALVRALARSGVKDLTVVSFGGPDVGLLIAAGAVDGWCAGSCRWTRSRSSRTTGGPARPARSS